MVGAKDGGLLKCVPCGFEIGGNGWDWFKWLCIRVGKMETNVWQRKINGVYRNSSLLDCNSFIVDNFEISLFFIVLCLFILNIQQ